MESYFRKTKKKKPPKYITAMELTMRRLIMVFAIWDTSVA